jgi:DNA-binding transcriptional MerR regulator
MAKNKVNGLENFRIKDVAMQCGLSEHTLRYYEKIGLIASVGRDGASNYRQYGADTVERIEALACLRATGMSISDMRRYLENMGGGLSAAADQRQLFERQSKIVARKMRAFKAQEAYLVSKVALWKAREERNKSAEKRAIEDVKQKAKTLKKYYA